MDIFKSFATDDNLELNGAWQKGQGTAEFLVARSQNTRYQRELAKYVEDNQELLEAKDDVADKRTNELMAQLYADTILFGWRGDVMYKGQPLTYSRENAITLLKHKEFRKFVARLSDNLEAYKAKLETEQGNA